MSSLVFCNCVIIGGHILNIYETIFPKLIFHLLLSYEVPDVLLHEFYIPSGYVINDCTKNNFNGFIIKNKWNVPLRYTCVGEFTVREFGY